jgi:PAS domain S-box-containing protein
MEKPGFGLHSLSAQMILSLIALVLLTAITAGAPAVWLIHDQLKRQAWAQVEQGRRATLALYAARQSDVTDLATLTAQRPTLRDLLAREEMPALPAYLDTLKMGAGLDLVQICDSEGRVVAQAGEWPPATACAATTERGFHVLAVDSASQAWLLGTHLIEVTANDVETRFLVMVGIALDDVFAVQMRDQTGLEHTVLVDGDPAATSLSGGAASHRPCPTLGYTAVEGGCRVTFDQEGAPYYAVRIPLSKSGLETEVALPVRDIVATQRRLVWTLVGSILVVAVVGSVVGTLLARRISQPLAHLTDAADILSQGDLSSPVQVEARVREVTLVAQALEGARVDLGRTLDQLRQEKTWTDRLLEAIVEGIVTLDSRGRITFFSHGAERITGMPRSQALDSSCDEIFRPLEVKESFYQLIPLPGIRQKIAVEFSNGRQAILAVTHAPLLPPDGGDVEVALVFRDVSEAEAVHRLLGHFLANVAHEFRTPLAAVGACVELLLDQAPDLSAEELGELLISLHLGVLGLQTLVDNLLESASIEAGHFRVSPRPSDLSNITAGAIRTMQPLLDKRGQSLTVELPAAIPVVRADPRRTVQVLVNLLSNASKYGPDEAEIAISATASADGVRVTVADQGPGIPPGQRADLFRRFVRPEPGDDRIAAQYGAGLGLSVVKAVVEAQGGQVGIDDRPGGGSIFWFTLPRGNGS